MSAIDNSLFSWCNAFYEAKENYNKHDFYLTARQYLQNKQGIDKGFLKAFLDTPENKFAYYNSYVPIYKIITNTEYSWSHKSSETDSGTFVDVTVTTTNYYSQIETHSKNFYWGIDYSTEPDTFIGSKPFYELNLPSDLKYRLYNSNKNCISQSYAEKLTKDIPKYYENKTSTILNWTCNVIFVPICYIAFVYNNKTYYFVYNLHNGGYSINFLLSNEAANAAKEAWAKQKTRNKISLITIIITAVLYVAHIIYTFSIDVFGGILVLVFNAIFYFFVIMHFYDYATLNTEKQFFTAYGTSIENGKYMEKKSKKEFIVYLIVDSIFVVIALIFAYISKL